VTVRACLIAGLGLVAVVAAGCGSKGPPLAPLRPVPEAPGGLAVRRVGDRITLNLKVPGASADPNAEVVIAAVEIYARTLPLGSETPTVAQLLRKENLVGRIEVRPDPVTPEPGADATTTPVPAAAPAGPPDARPARGETTVWTETIPTTAPRPLELNRQQQTTAGRRRPVWVPLRPTGLTVPISRETVPGVLPTRYYVAVGVSDRGRPGPASVVVALPFGPAPATPVLSTPTYDETELTVTWTTALPGTPVTIVEATSAGVEQPVPVQVAPLTRGSWSTPFEFGKERCFVARGVVRRGVSSTESETAGPVCVTPVDKFPPAAPAGLVPVSDPGGVTLLWDPVSAADLAGYLVLRAEGASETFLELTPKPITSVQYVDTTVRAGVRYVYVVVAVDASGNRSPRSNAVNR